MLKHEQQSYLEAGFDAFVGKPFRFEELCDCLQRLLPVKFDYVEDQKPGVALGALNPDDIRLPQALLAQLREAAGRYSVTRLEKGVAELEQNGETGRQVAAYLRGLIKAGNLDAVAEFLEKVKRD